MVEVRDRERVRTLLQAGSYTHARHRHSTNGEVNFPHITSFAVERFSCDDVSIVSHVFHCRGRDCEERCFIRDFANYATHANRVHAARSRPSQLLRNAVVFLSCHRYHMLCRDSFFRRIVSFATCERLRHRPMPGQNSYCFFRLTSYAHHTCPRHINLTFRGEHSHMPSP